MARASSTAPPTPLRQPGSSFKIFVYLTALLTGKYHKDTIVDACGICIGDYCVHNFDGESGGAMPLYIGARAVLQHRRDLDVGEDRRGLLAAEAEPITWARSPRSAAPRSSRRREKWG